MCRTDMIDFRGIGSFYKVGGQDRNSFLMIIKVGGQIYLLIKGNQKVVGHCPPYKPGSDAHGFIVT